jgi:transposase
MPQFIGCDAHKKYSVFVAVDEQGRAGPAVRVEHERARYCEFLAQLPPQSPIAIEASGHYYWIVDEMEKAGHQPQLADPREAKKRMGKTNKTDKLDAKGLGILLRNGTLPSVWIPPAVLRDQRELLRLRMFLVGLRTQVKNRIHGTIARYHLLAASTSDLFGVEGRRQLTACLSELPRHTRQSVEQALGALDEIEEQIATAETRLESLREESVEASLLQTLPGVGKILSMVLALEIGTVERFPSASHLASYAGLVPRVHASGGHTYLGQVRQDVNRHLKWALVEAANIIVMSQRRLADSHVVQLYQRLKRKKNHQKAVVAVARHLAEAAFWVLKKQESYREPQHKRPALSSTQG